LKKRIYILLLVFIPLLLPAQDFKNQYKKARELFAKEDYAKSMDAFKPLVVYDAKNPSPEYASYYYALSAYRMGFFSVAKDMFLQMRKLYPAWDQLNEVNYFLGKIYFDQREYFQALLTIKDIHQESFIDDLAAMKRNYLSPIQDTETLRMLYEEYPEDKEVAYALARAIAHQPYLEQDVNAMDAICIKFGFSKEEFASSEAPVSKMKDRYTVSLLFPFLSSTLDPSPVKKKNQFVLDLYEGIKLAQDTLAGQGIHIDVLAYDTERNSETLKKLLESDELKATDLLVGPLFQEEVKPVQEFSMSHKINVINPVSNNSDFLGQNSFALLSQPSHETIGTKSAEWVAEKVRKRTCMVYYGESVKDSVMAFSFIKKAIALGINVVYAEEIHKETMGRIISTLASPTEFDEFKNPIQFKLKVDSIGSIFVASDNPLIYSKVISSVETRGDSIRIVGNESWLRDTSIDLGIYERLGICLAAPTFSSSLNPNFIEFRRRYILKHGSFPSTYDNYARIGYEFMIFAGKALHQYGVYFQQGLSNAGIIPGFLSEGYNYTNSRDNQLVPFVQFLDGQLVVSDRR
jgi:tetratricopeptide (TPR) repeat protein